MRMSIRYLTTFTYDAEVSESQNALRARPASNERQRLIEYGVRIDPPVRVLSHTDYWGTNVDCFGVVGQHTRLTVVADSTVETSQAVAPIGAGAWPPLVVIDSLEAEFLAASPHVAWSEEVADFGREVVRTSTSLMDAVGSIHRAVHQVLKYEPGTTEIGVSVDQIFRQRSGVCQDYAHLALALYRSLDIPARYVSGYLYSADASTGDRPGEDEVEVSTHAWVEVFIPGFGWWGLDPTNQLEVGEQHVKIGHGRDYEDVMPLKGVYHGAAESGGLEARVRIGSARFDPYAMQPRPDLPGQAAEQQQQ